MKSKLINDANRDQGWARLEISFGETEAKRPAEDETFTFSVQKIPEQTFLQPAGGERWPSGGAEHFLSPDGQSWDGQTLVLELGPDFTSALAQVPCRLALKGSRGTEFSQIRVDTTAIKLPPADYKIVIDPQKLAEEERLRREAEEQQRRAEEERARQEEEQSEAEYDSPPDEFNSFQDPEDSEYGEYDEADPNQPSSSRKWLIAALVLLILALAGGLVWYFSDQLKLPSIGSFFGSELKPPPINLPPETPAIELSTDSSPAPAASADPKAEVQGLFRRGAAYAEMEAALARYDAQAGAEDAVFLLAMELAPVKPEYRTRLGSFFDPSDPRPSGSIVKNALTAYDEYEAAKKAGDAGAAAAQARLLQWAKDNAATDASAADLLNR